MRQEISFLGGGFFGLHIIVSIQQLTGKCCAYMVERVCEKLQCAQQVFRVTDGATISHKQNRGRRARWVSGVRKGDRAHRHMVR